MEQVGTVERIMKTPDTQCNIWIPVFCSKEEDGKKKYHRGLPEILVPYKHYDADTICKGIADHVNLDDKQLPCTSTLFRWRKWAIELYEKLIKSILSICPSSLLNVLKKIIDEYNSDSDGYVEAVYVFDSLKLWEIAELIKTMVVNDFAVKKEE